MSILQVLILGGISLFIRYVLKYRWRNWGILIANIFVLFWLQPSMPVRWLDFWLPVLTIFITMFSWGITSNFVNIFTRPNLWTLIGVVSCILVVGLTRYVSIDGFLTASRPPGITSVLVGIAILSIAGFFVIRSLQKTSFVYLAYILLLIVIFILLKQPDLSTWMSQRLREITGQDVARASAMDIRWLGFSYIVFRIIHTIRDRMNSRLPEVSLVEYMDYALFFPAIQAGPIDRIERYSRDLQKLTNNNSDQVISGFIKIFSGIFKKFVLADTLQLISLNEQNASLVNSTGWQWVVVYAYALQIFFDFSGYTDIAIGLGKIIGVNLPENFNKPYFQNTLTKFWNNWHITLTQWIRSYYFFPITRFIKGKNTFLPDILIALFTQVSTMAIIGLWHGVTWNFLIWGLWHGLGLFVQSRWSLLTYGVYERFDRRPFIKKFANLGSIFLTFNYVAIGWVWFALPQPELSIPVIMKLVGIK